MDLVIVGQGPEVSLVKRFCKLHSHIIYLGDQPYEKLPGLIANSFCSIIPKNNLGDRKRTGLSPVKFYESLSCGVPLIVTDLPFMSDLVKKYEFGVVVPLDKPDMIAKALQFLLNNPKEHAEMKKKARGYIVKGNTWRHRAKQTFEIIEKLTSD
jgi:glycosyltransferase involved in cell wall biosynthesis